MSWRESESQDSSSQNNLQLPFENKAVAFSEWGAMKETVPAGQLPILEVHTEGEDDGGIRATFDQSLAMLRYVGKLTGSYPSDPIQAMQVDAIIDTVEEANKFIAFTFQGPKSMFYGDKDLTSDEKLEMRQKIMDPSLKKNVAYVSEDTAGSKD